MNSFLSQIALADAMSLEGSRTARGAPVSPGGGSGRASRRRLGGARDPTGGAPRTGQPQYGGGEANDPLALTVSVMILLSAALLAGYMPARKASRIYPMTAVRHE